MVTKKATVKTAGADAKSGAAIAKSMPKSGRDPKGGLTAEGRAFFAARDGLHLKPGVTGPADTPEKMVRKGSFLVRTFTHPRGPMLDKNGSPTRLALSAHAWGEKVPATLNAAHTLAAKGHSLLAKYHAAQGKADAGKPTAAKKTVAPKKVVAKQTASKASTAGKSTKKSAKAATA